MRFAGAAVAAVIALVTPAAASEWVVCKAAAKDGPEIRVLLGAMEVIAVSRVDLTAGSQSWSTDPTVEGAGANRITVGQAFEDQDHMAIDLTDENVARMVAQLRIAKAADGGDVAMGGTLKVAGQGVWPVVCQGP
ncbi:MAG TPA: hypothetical protein PKE19_04145 [Aestuariivirga sp.]|jgi:hypothetical protein|nr:hypothetical protein [Aestuariivirga sp.]